MARTVADTALLLAVLSGPDPRATLALDMPPPALAAPADVTRMLAQDLHGVRVAWSADLGLPVEPDVRAAPPARAVLADVGCQILDATPDLTGADEVFRTWRALAVRDGVRAAAACPQIASWEIRIERS
jgi:amidase